MCNDFMKLRTYCEQILDMGTVENLAIKVGNREEVLFEKYFSKASSISENTLFDMASVTKIVVTTMLALIAIDKGLLSVDDSVEKFYPLPDDKRELTVQHLLTHTMGYGHKSLCAEGNTSDNVAEYILKIPCDIPVGSNVLYSCPGYILLGKILEKVFGETLDIAFKRYVANPLGMCDTVFGTTLSDVVNSNLKSEDKGKVNDYNCRFLGGICGNAGLFSNMKDMTTYVCMLLRHGEPLIGHETFGRAVKNYTADMDESRGLGFLYVDERYYQTGGLFSPGAIGHCGHTGQSVFVDLESGFYVIILSDATISTEKKYGQEHYDEVMQMRHDIHAVIKEDLQFR